MLPAIQVLRLSYASQSWIAFQNHAFAQQKILLCPDHSSRRPEKTLKQRNGWGLRETAGNFLKNNQNRRKPCYTDRPNETATLIHPRIEIRFVLKCEHNRQAFVLSISVMVSKKLIPARYFYVSGRLLNEAQGLFRTS